MCRLAFPDGTNLFIGLLSIPFVKDIVESYILIPYKQKKSHPKSRNVLDSSGALLCIIIRTFVISETPF